MAETVISVADAALNLADCVERAHFQNESFVVMKDGVAFAKIIPMADKPSRACDLLAALSKSPLSAEESEAWIRELEEARNALPPPVDRWE
jgi:hypothetical protein